MKKKKCIPKLTSTIFQKRTDNYLSRFDVEIVHSIHNTPIYILTVKYLACVLHSFQRYTNNKWFDLGKMKMESA